MGLPLMEIIASFNFKFKRQFVLPCILPVNALYRAACEAVKTSFYSSTAKKRS